jgi:hypothetical protein
MGGSKVALMPPDIVLQNEAQDGTLTDYTPEATETQRYLWDLYTECIDWVKKMAGRDEVVLIHNGDLCQGIKYPVELVSTRIADQIRIGAANLAAWTALPSLRAIRIVAGTAAHNLGEASAEILAGDMLQARFPGLDIKTFYHGLLEVNGVAVDVAHHGPHPGTRSWLQGNVARFYLRDLMMSEMMGGGKPPQLVLRGHYHQFVREELRMADYHSTLVVTPAFAMLGDHAIQAVRSPSRVVNGMVAFEIIDGEVLQMYDFVRSIDVRTREVL